MKKFLIYIFTILLLSNHSVFALDSSKLPNIAISTVDEITSDSSLPAQKSISRADLFEYLGKLFEKDILPSYKFINLQFTDVKVGSKEYDALQKLVYLDIIQNKKGRLFPEKTMSAFALYTYSENLFGINFSTLNKENLSKLKKRNATVEDLKKITLILQEALDKPELIPEVDAEILKQREMFLDVYETLINNHYDKDKLDETNMLYEAIAGLAEGTGDKYTTFFPPIENQSFQDSLSGEYEGIGAYVDMEVPGEVKIVSPITGSPSEKAGLKGGDIVLKVDGKEIGKNVSLQEVVTWIKGPAGTTVTLTIKRGEDIFDVDVLRAKIVIKEVEFKKTDSSTYYVQIKKFSDTVTTQFRESLKAITDDQNITKIVFDLRNNPGGYLDEVNSILSMMIKKGEVVSTVKYTDFSVSNKSKGYDLIDLTKYKVVILQNSGTASASEIMIGTLVDYFPEIITIGETTYGKGSVQTIKPYPDGSSLKFTIAKWFTGKTSTGIDGVGIEPKEELKLDEEEFKNGVDNQLNRALEIK